MARNPGHPTPRAYKFFTRDGSGEWLRRERDSLIAILNRLGEHDQIVDYEDVQVDDCQHPYLAFEYMAGGSLEEWILKDPTAAPLCRSSEIVRQVASGLAAAHGKGSSTATSSRPTSSSRAGPTRRSRSATSAWPRSPAHRPAPRRRSSARSAGWSGRRSTSRPRPSSGASAASPRRTTSSPSAWSGTSSSSARSSGPPTTSPPASPTRGPTRTRSASSSAAWPTPTAASSDAGEVLESLDETLPDRSRRPAGVPDVQHIAREYLAATLINAG